MLLLLVCFSSPPNCSCDLCRFACFQTFRMEDTGFQPSLVDLPDPCLLAVLRCLAYDPVSLFSAARAHSRLHQAAVVALSIITVMHKTQQQLDDSLLPYLGKHGQHIDSMVLQGHLVTRWGQDPAKQLQLQQLPTNLQLTSLQLDRCNVQLQPGNGFQGVLKPGLPLKQLQLGTHCTLLDEAGGLAAALHQLAVLENLSVSVSSPFVATAVLQQVQQLTYLDLHCQLEGDFRYDGTSLQPLQAMTRLADLRVGGYPNHRFTADMLSGLCSLTRLALTSTSLDPAALAGKTQLQHLELCKCYLPSGAAGVAELLSQLHDMTQRIHLDLGETLWDVDTSNHSATAFSALTASSKLQHLNVKYCLLPEGVWQHVFPAGRQLQNMQSVVLDCVKVAVRGSIRGREPLDYRHVAPGSSLVSCCPELQHLDMQFLHCSSELVSALPGQSRLTMLRMGAVDGVSGTEALEAICQLTGPRDLQLISHSEPQGVLLLTDLKMLTHLCIQHVMGCLYFTVGVMSHL
jgi:hypothetical protein